MKKSRKTSRDATGTDADLYDGSAGPWSKLPPADKFAAMWIQHGYGGMDDIADEYRFDDYRKWRFDFAWPTRMVAVEIHGFGFGHQAQQALANDCEKLRAAILLGWTVIPFTTRCISSTRKCYEAVDVVCQVLENAT